MARSKGWVIEFAEQDLDGVEGLREDIADTLSVMDCNIRFGGHIMEVDDSQTALIIKLRFGDHIARVEKQKTA